MAPSPLFSNSRLTLATLALTVACASGCGSDLAFEAEMMALPDGAVLRKSRFVFEEFQREEVAKSYALPPGGSWEYRAQEPLDSKKQWREATTIQYRVEAQNPPGTVLESDFRRKAQYSSQEARNEPSLTAHDFIFVKTFEYEERFRDIVTTESFQRAAREFYEDVIGRTVELLANERAIGLTTSQVSAAIRSAFDPLLEALLADLRSHDLHTALKKQESEPWEALLREKTESLAAETGSNDTWLETIKTALDKAIEAALKEHPAYWEEFSGAHGFKLFESYSFTIALTLPGELVESNATRQEGNRLIWTFLDRDFLYKDHVLHASSRLIYPERIAAAGAALLAIFAGCFIWWRAGRTRTGERIGS